jgi:hypothetical protein
MLFLHPEPEGLDMQMDAADIRKFPKFAAYVSTKIPEVAKVPVIINAIQKFAGTIDKDTIKDALLWGHGPTIKIVKNLQCAGDDAIGCFTSNNHSTEIRIEEDVVTEFESGKGLRKTPKGQLVFLAGVTLLHELTHWADDQDGVDTPGEEGELFEQEVYGGVIN